jgi:hypothetical protein
MNVRMYSIDKVDRFEIVLVKELPVNEDAEKAAATPARCRVIMAMQRIDFIVSCIIVAFSSTFVSKGGKKSQLIESNVVLV